MPTHYDDFFKPLGESPGFVTNVKLAEVPEEVARVSSAASVAALPRVDAGDYSPASSSSSLDSSWSASP